ncbi:Mth938-like domain-containing protein [Niveibacterium terrae]|uniref:Mth938-like domain-containing protein n=1 Tax=Niveibacterium terrae TaxID=3373598 RepID=UPI003A959B24
MKLLLEQNPGLELISAQGPGYVEINGRRYENSLIVLPDRVLDDWRVTDFASLAAANCTRLAELGAAITLIGTGERQRFPSPALLRGLIEAGRGFEIMDTAAACRTYNILASEGRDVCAALLIEH